MLNTIKEVRLAPAPHHRPWPSTCRPAPSLSRGAAISLHFKPNNFQQHQPGLHTEVGVTSSVEFTSSIVLVSRTCSRGTARRGPVGPEGHGQPRGTWPPTRGHSPELRRRQQHPEPSTWAITSQAESFSLKKNPNLIKIIISSELQDVLPAPVLWQRSLSSQACGLSQPLLLPRLPSPGKMSQIHRQSPKTVPRGSPATPPQPVPPPAHP